MGTTCPNCGAQLSCGCQRRTASDGTMCCDQCIQTYEQKNIATKVNTPTG
jgi:hypothetical protein